MLGLLHTIVRRFHCHATHQRFAWDAIPLVRTDAGRRLVRMVYRHHRRYLNGATDPDTRFCDFQNHVIHAREGFWGGAPRVAHAWYDRLLRYLRTHRYSDAAHALGVLSHYFTDPLHPLHTHHDERERILHGPIEWSIHCGYDSLYRAWRRSDDRIVFQLSNGPGWLGEAMLHGARYASGKYEILLDGYDPNHTLDEPIQAMSSDAQAAMSEMFGLTITGWARVLERAAKDAEAESGKPLPRFGNALSFALATARIPTQRFAGWSEHCDLRIQVARLLEEWLVTGTVQNNLPTEVDIVHRVVRVRRDEQLWKQERARRLESRSTSITVQPRRLAA